MVWHVAGATEWIKGMLKRGAEHDAWLMPKNIFSAVAVMHVEIHYCDPFKFVHGEGMCSTHGNIVEKTKAHSPRTLCMMSGRPYAAKHRTCLIAHHQVDAVHRSASGAQGRRKRMRVHRRIRINPYHAVAWRRLKDVIDILWSVNTQQLLASRQRRIVVAQHRVQAAGYHAVLDCAEPRRALGMCCPHFVACTVRMGNKTDRHVIFADDEQYAVC